MDLVAEMPGELAAGVNYTDGVLLLDDGAPILLEDFGFNATGESNRSVHMQLSDLLMDDSDAKFHRIISILHVYVLPIIILIGIVGNSVSFLLYVSTPRLYRQSSSLYLAFLAAVDNISLIFIFAVWFGWIGIHMDRDPHIPQERLVSDDHVLYVRVQFPVCVDGGQFHGGAMDCSVSPVEASPAVYSPSSDQRHGLSDSHFSRLLLVLSLHDERQILSRSARLRHP